VALSVSTVGTGKMDHCVPSPGCTGVLRLGDTAGTDTRSPRVAPVYTAGTPAPKLLWHCSDCRALVDQAAE